MNMRPNSEKELAEIVAATQTPLRIVGGGTRPIGKPCSAAPLHVSGLSGVTIYEPGALTLVAKAGTPLSDIETILEAEGQRLAFEPMDHRPLLRTEGTPTIGGVVAGNISGPRRVSSVGSCRDALLGVRYVDGMGNIVKNGGRVMKNVTGYDLVKLFAGSWGTLGILSEVSLKVLPKPEAQATIILRDLEFSQAQEAMTIALNSPYEVTGAACDVQTKETFIRVEGFAASVQYRTGSLMKLLDLRTPFDLVSDSAASELIWRNIRDVVCLADQDGDIWKLSVRPGDAPSILARADARQALVDWGGGLIWLRLDEGTDLRSRLGTISGHATLIRASDKTKNKLSVFQPEAATVAKLSRGLRAKFDPRNILNPGLMH